MKPQLLLLLFLLGVLTTNMLVQAAWTQRGNSPSRTYHSDAMSIVNPTIAWTSQILGGVGLRVPVLSLDEKSLYVIGVKTDGSYQLTLNAVDTTNGNIIYALPLGPNSSPWGQDLALSQDGKVLVACTQGANLSGKDDCTYSGFLASTGTEIWTQSFNNCTSYSGSVLMVVDGSTDFIVTTGDVIVRMNSLTGKIIWESKRQYPIQTDLRGGDITLGNQQLFKMTSPCGTQYCNTSILSYSAITGNLIYNSPVDFGTLGTDFSYDSYSNHLLGVDAAYGSEPAGVEGFDATTGKRAFFVSSFSFGPWFGGTLAKCGSSDSMFYNMPITRIGFNTTSGSQFWSTSTDASMMVSNYMAATYDGIVYVQTQPTKNSRVLSAFDCSTGEMKWSLSLPWQRVFIFNDESQIIGSDGSVYVVTEPNYITKVVSK